MKIAIVTLPLDLNYGGILQCYALQTVLQCMGHKVIVLEKPKYRWFYPVIRMLTICKRFFKRYMLRKKVNILLPPHEIVNKNINLFIHRYIHHCYKRVWSPQTMRDIDAFVVGSDQIWSPKYSHPIENAFLDFTKDMNVKRVAYAASFGAEQCIFSEKQLSLCSVLLKQFDAVSVREDSGIRICKESFGVEAVQMLDPTLLLDADDYRKLISKAQTIPTKGNLLVYVLDITDEKKKMVEQIAEERGLTPYWLDNDTNSESVNWDGKIKMHVEQWLRAFDETTFVFTDSFHGCVFSILFKKTFIAVANENRGIGRFISLLKLFSLNERLIFSYKEYENRKQILKDDIDYVSIHEKLVRERNKAFNFIKTYLS